MPRVFVKNLHFKKKVRLKKIKRLAQKVLQEEKNKQNVNIILADDEYITRLNRKFLKRNRSTDVLCFGMQEGEQLAPEPEILGEIYVSLDKAEKQAKEYNQSFQDEVNLLVIHGLLHLLGYDHQRQKQREKMRKKEQKYLYSAK